jgi:glucose-6-phosphate 1-dehydrogenase
MTKMSPHLNAGEVERPGDPCVLVIFGAAGDLTKRKLIPALYNLRKHRLLPKDVAVLGVARRELTDEQFRGEITENIHSFATDGVDEKVWDEFRPALYYQAGEFTNPTLYTKLAERLKTINATHRCGGNVLFYLSTPPDFFGTIVKGIGAAGLAKEEGTQWRRVIVEKPFGRDLDSARALNAEITSVLRERQIYRIDHYLGKETVQNMMVFRFANGLFEPIWNHNYIDHVQISVAEAVGVEGRGNYYETAGVIRDMIQNHMFQLLALIAMEPPISFKPEDVRNERVKVLHAIRPMAPEEILTNAVRGQYGEGYVDGKKFPAYRSETNVSASSNIETYAAMKLAVDNWRWSGVPFYLRSGKALAKRDTEIVIEFKRPPQLLFKNFLNDIEPNRLVLKIQPNETISIEIKAKRPGATIKLEHVRLEFSYADFGDSPATTGYERLLYDCMIGDSTLYHRADMVEAAWEIATPILDLWSSLPARDFPNYPAGTWGPESSNQLMQRDGRRWHQM